MKAEHLTVTYDMTDRSRPHFLVGVEDRSGPIPRTRWIAELTEREDGDWVIDWSTIEPVVHAINPVHRTMRTALRAIARAHDLVRFGVPT